MKNELYYNYKKSLEQKYNAICFDIDGTLTEKNSKKIDDRAIKMIIELLKKKVPIVFITGRGETGLNYLKKDMYDSIVNSIGITESGIKRIYVLTNDGARLFYSNDISYKEFLSQDTYITSKSELDQLRQLDEVIKNINSNYFDTTYSRDLKTNTIINIRLVFKTNDSNIINKMYDIIEKNIVANKFKGLNLTRGIYMNKYVLQIGTTTKDKAIERAEKIIGVPKNSMMRIGDCGDIHGNDYLMLNCNQGYSVDKVSGSVDSCFPVFDKNGNILRGVTATIELINNSKILPTVCLEKANISSYKFNFATAEKNIVLGRKKLLKKYNELIDKNFEVDDGIDSLFDKSSGSILIPIYEWELMSNNPLKEFWNSQDSGNFKYLLRDDNNFLLRGSSTYYYFLANRISENGNDTTTKNNVLEWHSNYMRFLNDAEQAVSNTKEINSLINKKLLLGILDNCRNVLLVIMNRKLVSNNLNDNILLDISSRDNKQFNDIYNVLFEIENIMIKICFDESNLIKNDLVSYLLSKSKNIVYDNFIIEKSSNDKGDYSKDYRAYREIDNFGENYTAVSLYKEKRNNISEYINACGLSYGGIELPIIAKIVDKNKIESILLLKFNKEVSGYSNKQLIDLRKFNINEYGGLINSNIFRYSDVDLFDDNVLTGKTLQLAINSLYDSDIDVNNICIVRYPGINRIDQMFLDNIAAVDFHLFFDYIYGLCYSSPYSWKDNEWKDKDGKIDYKDSIGVFDINRKKIVECLIKNHDYNENSEVGEYKRRVLK